MCEVCVMCEGAAGATCVGVMCVGAMCEVCVMCDV